MRLNASFQSKTEIEWIVIAAKQRVSVTRDPFITVFGGFSNGLGPSARAVVGYFI